MSHIIFLIKERINFLSDYRGAMDPHPVRHKKNACKGLKTWQWLRYIAIKRLRRLFMKKLPFYFRVR